MRFSSVVEFLADMGHRPYVLESNDARKRVLCAPSLVGRVMTSTLDGPDGNSLGRIGVDAIRKGPVDPVFNDFGGEERFWFGPEGSQFGLNFTSMDQTLANYRVQAGMSSIPYEIVQTVADLGLLTMQSNMGLANCFGTHFTVNVSRTIRILESCPYTLGCSDHLDCVGFQSETRVTNISDKPINSETGPLSAWTIGQQQSGPRCVVVVPLQCGLPSDLGEPIRQDYLADLCPAGSVPSSKWSVRKGHVLLKTEGDYPMKIGIGKKRAKNRFGSIDLDRNHLIINDFDLFPEMDYVAPYWRSLSSEELLDGEAISVYVDGPAEAGRPKGDFYELETLSPALTLLPNESFTHRNRVFHVRGDLRVLGEICARSFGAVLTDMERFATD